MSARIHKHLFFLKESAEAIQLRQSIPNRGPVTAWVPLSQVDHISKHGKNKDGETPCVVTMTDWIAEQKGFIE
jgi:hypothetical protein